MKTLEERKEILNKKIIHEVGRGFQLESHTDTMAVLSYGHKPNHLLHFFIGLFTFGLWWIAWAIIAMTGQPSRYMITVDEAGNISSHEVRG